MYYLEVNVKTAIIVHGFDEKNKEIIEEINEDKYVKKIVALNRILSISESYLLVTSSHGRVMYWEYEEPMDEIMGKIRKAGLLLT